jgi:hypothetical protein
MPSLRLSMLLFFAALAGCSTMKIRTEYDPTAPFVKYRTYAWIAAPPGPEQAAPIRNPQIHARVVAALDREMASKGLVKTSMEAGPDFLVSVLGWAKTRIDVRTYGYAYVPVYAYGPGPVRAVPVTEVRQYADGTLLLDFVDAKTMKLVWRGTASDTITTAEDVQRGIDEAAHKLVAAYPPKPQ